MVGREGKNAMKIVRIETIPLAIPFASGARISGWRARSYAALETLLLRVETSDGIVGWGEAFSYNCQAAVRAAVDRMVAPLAVGRDARDIAGLLHELQRTLHIYGRYGIANFALSGLDIALWDIAAKRAGRRLVELLGGGARTELDAYASLFRFEDPEQVAARVRVALADGYRFIKLHERGVAEVKAAREAAGAETPLMLDTNCAWTPAEARDMARRLAPLDLRWIEEPIFPPEDFQSLARLRAEGGIPIAAGENACTAFEFQKLLAARAVSYAQPSVTKVGGITEFRKVAALAEADGIALAPHSPYFGPGFLATLHLIAAQPAPMPVEHFYLSLEAMPYGALNMPVGGKFRLPAEPGLGPDPDPAVIKDFRIRDI